ncbi:alpha/beta fold hydrolase [Thalassorhabdomicrobium marinisediminis]|uniref:alpha/beta fold hydrolase n=1 Tax=Thalassorhabdomicrobium marinisediminis TaxID=2170577 RepID=UPI00249391DB|nr:alpha/beta fold hydrolase [Thalassorhabdomicrobium marinisediminis]
MHKINTKDAELFATESGQGPTVVFAHCLGLDHHVWDGVVERLPDHRCIRYDMRGHGRSDAPEGPYAMGTLVADAEAICDALELENVVFVGVSLGGMIAQGLAVKRLDLVRGLVLSGTAAKFGQPEPWHARAASARSGGMAALAPDIISRWQPVPDMPPVQKRLTSTDAEGYAATCEAIAGTDFYTPTSGLRLPTMGLCGDADRSTPPDLVRETVELIPGSSFHLIRGAGHLAPLTHAEEVADHIRTFLTSIGHI